MSALLRTTPLHALHQELGGRLVDFAGWELPIQFEGVVAEHTWCRAKAGLFDVSHMGLIELRGDNPAVALEALTPAGISTLKLGAMRYGLLTNAAGGIIDDFMATNNGAHLAMVINASRREVDVAHLREHLGDIEITERPDVALLALQGPAAAAALARVAPDAALAELFFLQTATIDIDGIEVGISRSGYTGEDGFELIVPGDAADAVARKLLAQPEVKPIGLGARDTLRLEAGLCLYGNDLDETTSPVEANLLWSMPKRRREAGDFLGGDRVRREIAEGVTRRRVGIAPEGKRPVREGAALSLDGSPVGTVCSGGHGPSVDRPVAMAYVAPEHAEPGTQLIADVRGKDVPVIVSTLPFAPHNYHRPT